MENIPLPLYSGGRSIAELHRENGKLRIVFFGLPDIGSDEYERRNRRALVSKIYTLARMVRVSNREGYVMIRCFIARKHHGSVFGPRCSTVQQLCYAYNVCIILPQREVNSMAGVGEDITLDDTDTIVIWGKEENCLKVRKALLDSVPRAFIFASIKEAYWLGYVDPSFVYSS